MKRGIGLCWVLLCGSTLGCGAAAKDSVAAPEPPPAQSQPSVAQPPEPTESPTQIDEAKGLAITPPTPAALRELTYEAFVEQWMGRLKPNTLPAASFASFSTRPLMQLVDVLAAGKSFATWCRGKAGRSTTLDQGQALERLGAPNLDHGAAAPTIAYCLEDGRLVAALAFQPNSGEDKGELLLTHYSQHSLSVLPGVLAAAGSPAPPSPSASSPGPSDSVPRGPSPSPSSEAERIRLENFSGLTGIAEYVSENAPSELRAFLAKGQYAIFAEHSRSIRRTLAVATVGGSSV